MILHPFKGNSSDKQMLLEGEGFLSSRSTFISTAFIAEWTEPAKQHFICVKSHVNVIQIKILTAEDKTRVFKRQFMSEKGYVSGSRAIASQIQNQPQELSLVNSIQEQVIK